MRALLLSALLSSLCMPALVSAAEGDFLRPLAGQWKGSGMVLTRIGAKPINVTCGFDIGSGATNLSMKGNCRGLLVVRRSVNADIRANGQSYSGTYTGPSGIPSALSGSRKGNAINLAVRWARDINGDRSANMVLEKVADNRLLLQTIDKDPATGKSVVTSRIDLSR
ncbi:hypothetical protein EPK99_05580 [Neorhizobium lilium]|uniref:Uncharacterized protein n=1 Tax=Neorhizobium lilium TaxID=2503024 RepID=A0A444LN78_9HYPH|nr:hypothetical protein [Neorhizobium lilium]RWX81728.1 hypothetical protein EPK99_05580 [Neorhizobium lilium]